MISPQKRSWIIVTIMLLAILEVLDSTIVNVALKSMMASLGANQDQITWVVTSYVVASAVVLPLTGFLMTRFGRKNFLLICAIGFMISSFLCGASNSLAMMVIFRVMQGAFGSSLIPISQAILRETFPLEEQGKAMAIWGLGIMAAPVCGPTLGGFITEHASWRWVFYINLPVCIIGIMLILWVIEQTQPLKQAIDWFGLFFVTLGIAALQIMLDQGNQLDWFSSHEIIILTALSILGLTTFIWHSAQARQPLIKLALYRDHNFRICSLIMLTFCGTLFSFITITPIMLQSLFNYPAITTGWIMAPLGIASGVAMMFVSRLMYQIPIKPLLISCILICGIGAFRYAHITLTTDVHYFMWANACLGFGMGGLMVPLSTYALATIDRNDLTEASGLFSYARMLGTSIGVSLLSTYISRHSQTNWHQLISHLAPFNPQLTAWLQAQHLTSVNNLALSRLDMQLNQQANFMAFVSAFWLISASFVMLSLFVLRLKTVKLDSSIPVGEH